MLFWAAPNRFRLPLLLVASYVFYASWMPIFLLLVVGLTIFNYIFGKVLSTQVKHRKLLFGIGIATNLMVLGVFKYANFALDSVGKVVQLATGHSGTWHVNIILPLAISFFIFEFIHYLFEIYRGNKPVGSFVLFALYAAFFPTQIAGPIKRYPDFVEQMLAPRTIKLSDFDEGIPLIITGLAKKLLLADTLSIFVQMGYADPSAYGALELWLFAFAFAFQIYFDFSGYTDIGRGSAMLFGYHIPINFNMPYVARNISDFWRRWHISLSTWLRDYLFIPLGGSRSSRAKVSRNLILTMALGGLWHGASWNFMAWGIYHGLLLVAHREFVAFKEQKEALRKLVDSKAGEVFCMLFTFAVVCIGWVFFRVQDIKVAFSVVRKMVTFSPLLTKAEAHHMLVLNDHLPVVVPICLILIVGLLIANLPISFCNEQGHFRRAHPILKGAYCAVAVVLIAMFSPDNSTPFIYFQF